MLDYRKEYKKVFCTNAEGVSRIRVEMFGMPPVILLSYYYQLRQDTKMEGCKKGGGRHKKTVLLFFRRKSKRARPPPTVGNFWHPCGNSPTVQNVYVLVQFVSKIDQLLPGLILYF